MSEPRAGTFWWWLDRNADAVVIALVVTLPFVVLMLVVIFASVGGS